MPAQYLIGGRDSAKVDAAKQVSEPRIIADWVEVGMGLEELEDVRLFPIGKLEPEEGLFGVAQAQICIHKSTRRNVACLSAPVQLREEPQGVAAPPGAGVRMDEHAR